MKWLEGYNDRLIFAVDYTQIDRAIYDLPILLVLDNTLIDFSKIRDDGNDIRIVPANHERELPYEYEIFDKSGETIKLWFKLDSIPSNTPTFFYLYFNNPSETNPGENKSQLWSECKCVFVMHFKSNNLFEDSTGLNTYSSNTGSTLTSSQGPIGTSWDINQDSEVIFPYISQYSLNTWTFECYAYQKTTSVYWNGIMGTRFGSDYTFDVKIKNDPYNNIHKGRIDVGNGSQWIHYEDYGNDIGIEWFHMAFSVKNDLFSYFQNGVRTDGYAPSGDYIPLFMKSNQTLRVGRSRPADEYGRYIMEELRIYTEYKDRYFINASYKAILNQLVIYNQDDVKDLLPKSKIYAIF